MTVTDRNILTSFSSSSDAKRTENHSKTDKIATYIKVSNIIFGLMLLLSIVFNPLLLTSLGFASLTTYSWVIISATGGISGIILIFNRVLYNNALQRKNLLLDMARKNDFKRGEAPLGLKNSSCNCWANSLIQFIMNIPSIQTGIKNLDKSDNLSKLNDFVNIYENDARDQKKILSSIDSQNFRELVAAEKGSTFSKNPAVQQDVFEACRILEKIFPRTDLQCKKMFFYDRDLPEKVSSDGYSLIKDNSFFERAINEFTKIIPISLNFSKLSGVLSNPTLVSVIDEDFNKHSSDVSLQSEDGQRHVYPKLKTEWRIIKPPEDLFFNFIRYVFLDVPSEENIEQSNTCKRQPNLIPEKINNNVNVPFFLSLQKGRHILDSDANYELDSCIIHEGCSVKCGHYISIIKKSGVWFKCNDDKIEVISEIDALGLAAQSYLVHYKKI